MTRPGKPSHKSSYTELELKYRYILAWCKYVDSKPYYLLEQLKAAEKSNAPQDAYSQRPDGTWRTIEHLATIDPGTAQALKGWAAYVK